MFLCCNCSCAVNNLVHRIILGFANNFSITGCFGFTTDYGVTEDPGLVDYCVENDLV